MLRGLIHRITFYGLKKLRKFFEPDNIIGDKFLRRLICRVIGGDKS
ncbi:MAG: hypothetical protein WCW53_08490 [Syntrophales bacterium]